MSDAYTSLLDLGVVNDPTQIHVAANTAAYMAALSSASDAFTLVHPEGLTVYLDAIKIAAPVSLIINGTIYLADAQNASVFTIESGNVYISGTGTINGNASKQTGGVSTIVGGIVSNISTTNSTSPLSAITPITYDNVHISGITITNVLMWPIALGYATNSTITGTTLTNSGKSSMFMFSAIGCSFDNNTVYSIQDTGFTFYQGANQCTANNNTIHECSGGIYVQDLNGVSSPNQSITIMGNHVYNNTGNGIALTTGGTVTFQQQQHVNIYGNMLYNNNTAGTVGNGSINIQSSRGIMVHGNNIFGDGSTSTSGGKSYGIYVDSLSSFISVNTNTIGDIGARTGSAVNYGTGTSAYAIYTGQGTGIYIDSTPNCLIGSNCLYNTVGALGVMLYGIDGTLVASSIITGNNFLGVISSGGSANNIPTT